MRRTLTAVFLATLVCTPAFALNRSWNGQVSASWSEPRNWTPEGAPATADDLTFPHWPPRRIVHYDLPAGTSVGAITFSDDTTAPVGQSTYTITGNPMTLTGDVTVRSGLGTSGVVIENHLRLGNAIRFAGPQQLTVNGTLDVNAQTLTLGTAFTHIHGPVIGSGTIVVSAADTPGISLSGGGSFSGTVQGSASVTGAYPNATFNSPRLAGSGTTGPASVQWLSPGGWSPALASDPHDIATLHTGPLAIASQYSVDIGPGGSDRVVVAGTVSVAGTLGVTVPGGAPLAATAYTIIENDGGEPVSGTFAGLAEGATFTVQSTTFTISYRGGSGNDVVLTTGPSTKTWNGSASSLWSDPANWSPAAVPAAGEPLLFPPAGRLAMTNDLPAGFTVGTMTFESNYVLGGNALTLTGDIQFASGVRFQTSADLRLGASVRFHAAAISTYDGAIDVNGRILTIDTVSAGYDAQYISTKLRGALHGAGTIAITGPRLSIVGSGSFSGTIHGNADIAGAYPNATVTSPSLGGAGSLGAVAAGTLSPGAAGAYGANARGVVGSLHTGPLSISSAYIVDVVSGTVDRVHVAGSVSIGGELQAFTNGGTPADGQSFTIIENDGSDAVSGTFAGLPEGSALTVGPSRTTFRISYVGGDGNDVVLTAIPPGSQFWKGLAGANWSQANNWEPARVPVADADLDFPAWSTSRNVQFDLAPGTSVGGMAFHADYTLRGNAMTLTRDLRFGYGEVVFHNDLAIGRAIRFSGADAVTIHGTLDANGQTLTIATLFTNLHGPLSGNGTILVSAADTPGISLTGGGSFSGTIEGSAFVTGAYPSATFHSARLTGTGTTGPANVQWLGPGGWSPALVSDPHDVGTLRTGPLAIASQYAIDIVPGGAHDRVVVAGTVSLAGTLAVTIAGGASTLPAASYTIIENDGTDAVSGTFTGKPEGATFTAGTTLFVITYAGGDGNDVVLSTVPAGPRTWNGSASGLWSNPANWSPAAVPVSGEPLLFPAGARLTMTNDLPAFRPGSMAFKADYILNGNELTLAEGLEFDGAVAFTCNAPLKLAGPTTFHPSARQRYAGPIDVNGQTLTLETVDTIVGPVNGTGTIVVRGAGLGLRNSGTFHGAIDGTVDFVGSHPGAAVTAARVTGDGTLGAVTAAILAPGSSYPNDPESSAIGTLRTGPLSILSYFRVDLAPASASDQVIVTGTVSIEGFLLVKLVGGTPTPGQTFTIIDNDGTDAVVGTFTGKPEGAPIVVGSTVFAVSYKGGDGNDVVLTNDGKHTTTTALTQNRATTQQHQPVTFAATVSSAGGVPVGTVSFFDGSASIGTAPLVNGVAELTVKTLAIGAHDISAFYAGTDPFAASSSASIVHNVIRGNPNMTIASSSASIPYGDPVSFSIAVTGTSEGAGTPGGTVTVAVDGSAAGTATLAADGTATITVPMLPAGVHTITADYSGDSAYNGATGSTTQTVTKAQTIVALQSLANPSPLGLPVTVAIQVSPTRHPGMAVGGNVVVASDGRMVSEAQLIAGAAAVRVGPLTGGEYEIAVQYAGNENFQPATAKLMQHVAEPAVVIPTTSLAEDDGAYDAIVRVDLSAASASPVTVDYRTVDDTTTANVDYLASSGTLVFHPGQTSATIPIRILGDAAIEPDEVFAIELTNAAGAVIAIDRVPLVITNDDVPYRAPVAYTIATQGGAAVQATFFAPAGSAGPWPAIVWVPGDKAYDGAGGDIAALRETVHGYAVLRVAYRSAATAPFPAQILDLRAAVRWLRANAVTLNIDPTRIAAWGTGAGGHLAALLGTGMDAADPASRVQAVVVWGGITDLSALQSDAIRCSTISWSSPASPASRLIGCPLQQCPESALATAPARYANAGDAPMLLVHGRDDCFAGPRQSERLYDALRRAGGDATLRIIDFTGHDDAYWTSAAALAEVHAFLEAKLKGGSGRRRSVRY